jgi:hypothetical protein
MREAVDDGVLKLIGPLKEVRKRIFNCSRAGGSCGHREMVVWAEAQRVAPSGT